MRPMSAIAFTLWLTEHGILARWSKIRTIFDREVRILVHTIEGEG